jgi:hypothetical protein
MNGMIALYEASLPYIKEPTKNYGAWELALPFVRTSHRTGSVTYFEVAEIINCEDMLKPPPDNKYL